MKTRTNHSFFTTTVIIENEVSLNQQMAQFWKTEEIIPKRIVSLEEKACVDHFENTVKRNDEGRFVVELPIKNNGNNLGESKSKAITQFLSSERRLSKNEKLKRDYVQFMQEYEELQHMQEVPDERQSSCQQNNYFMPHHAVVRDDKVTTKTRIVFNASSPSSTGVSLNDTLMVGPVIQEDIVCILIRFRTHRYALCADIEKMYRQVCVAEKDWPLQQIVWRSNPAENIKSYYLKTLTFGTAPASFIATACLKRLAEENKREYPVACQAIEFDMYMDDLLTGANTKEEAATLGNTISGLLLSARFVLRKWTSNDPSILVNINNENNDTMHTMSIGNDAIKTLGLLWNTADDVYLYKYNTAVTGNQRPITKRYILSTIAAIYDPLGLISPIVVVAKIIIQLLWKMSMQWDEPVSERISTDWNAFCDSLTQIDCLKIPRRIIGCDAFKFIQIHGFSDASEKAFGACVYLRATDAHENHTVRLVASKSRVAPLKVITLARLELCAAVLLSRLVKKIVSCLRLNINNTYYWSDSTIVLAWLSSSPTRWKTFVAHRVGEIPENSAAVQWKHVPTKQNPADLISRGCDVKMLLDNNLWWQGPDFLRQESSMWPKISRSYETCVEEKKNVMVAIAENQESSIIERFSSLPKLLRVISYVMRFKSPFKFNSINVSECEIREVLIKLIKLEQKKHFVEEIKCLQKCVFISGRSQLNRLNAFLDEHQVIRVGGRLNNSVVASRDKKNPILLPSKSKLTKLIFENEHIRLLHAGPQALLSSLREKYWPLNGRNISSSTVNQCIACFRSRPNVYQPIMGNLPSSRVDAFERAFFAAGVDYAGPINIKSGLRKNAPVVKAYVSLFVCFSSKAVHLELVSDLTTESFLNALRRFWARIGMNKYMYSDNATNMVGANRKLKELIELFKSKDHLEAVNRCSAALGVKWCFIPARSPHFGGLWESSVKSVKKHLTRSFGEASLSYEELYTALVRIEACLNSRPITPLSTDPSDLNALTPAHFLIGGSLTEIPEPDLTKITPNRLRRWQRVTQLTQQVWNRWQTEYLSTLQYRAK